MDARLHKYAELVLEKNKLLNLTAAASVEEILERHVADGLAPLEWLKKRLPAGGTLADVGSGAGFVGIALKCAWPELEVTLLESRKGRTEFLEWAAAKLGIKVDVQRVRAESAAERGHVFDIVVERALAPLEEARALCLPLTKPGGVFLAYQSEPGGTPEPADTIRYRLAGEKKDRFILCYPR